MDIGPSLREKNHGQPTLQLGKTASNCTAKFQGFKQPSVRFRTLPITCLLYCQFLSGKRRSWLVFTRNIFPQKRLTRSRMLPLTRQQAAATEVKMDPICLKWFQILPVEIKILLTTRFSSSGAKSISLSRKFKV